MQHNKRVIISILVIIFIGGAVAVAVNRHQNRIVVLPENKTDGAFTDKTNQAVNIKAAKGRILSPQGDIVARKGDTLHVRIVDTDDPEEIDIRIPDFEQSTTFSQNSAGDLDFTVNKAGRFPIYFQPEDEARYKVTNIIVR